MLKALTVFVDMVIFSAPASARFDHHGLEVSLLYCEGTKCETNLIF